MCWYGVETCYAEACGTHWTFLFLILEASTVRLASNLLWLSAVVFLCRLAFLVFCVAGGLWVVAIGLPGLPVGASLDGGMCARRACPVDCELDLRIFTVPRKQIKTTTVMNGECVTTPPPYM
jgi:hypothetical protein